MKVHVIGGGPAGLYFAILMKKAWPQTAITVFERNRPDDTFGFGVVFSDQTLETFESYDRESYRAIIDALRLLGRHRDPFQRHGPPHRRQRLLRLLARHAAEAARPARALARRGAQVPVGSRSDARSGDQRTPISSSRPTASTARARRLCTISSAQHRSAAEQLRLDGLDPAVRRLHVLLPRNRARHLHRALLPVRARPLDLDDRDRSADLRARRARPARRGRRPRISGRGVRGGAAGPQAHHQPLDLAQLPDHPQRALGEGQHAC